MKLSASVVGLLAPLALVAGHLSAAHAQANDMFPTRTAAEQRAKQLKCSGAFAMGNEWMPCQTLEAYEKAVKQAGS